MLTSRFRTFVRSVDAAYFQARVDSASLIAFRALFGCVLAAAAVRFMWKGWVDTQLIQPRFHFSYPGLTFLRPWPRGWMYCHFAVLIVAALGLAVGYRPRLCALITALGWTYLELLDRALYLNHYYLACLMAWLLVVVPGAGDRMARGCLLALRWQVGCVYVFAGLAKLDADWLLRAQPLRIWLAARSDVPWLGPLLAQPATAFAASWFGALFDLSIVAFLLCRATRRWAFGVALLFHVATGLLFPIGMFPWLMLACLTLFFEPDWPRPWLAGRAGALRAPKLRRELGALLALHCAVQAFVPLYARFASRDRAWTGEGFDFAWNVMLVEKAGSVRFRARDRASGAETVVAPDRYLTAQQERAMSHDPRLIRALARQIARDAGPDVAVYADAFATLNGRRVQRLIAADVDLSSAESARWIVPLEPP